LRVILPGFTLGRREDGPLLQFARLALIVADAQPERRAAGDSSRADAAVPGRAKSGRRRPGAQRSPEGPAWQWTGAAPCPDQPNLRAALAKVGGQPGPARSARP